LRTGGKVADRAGFVLLILGVLAILALAVVGWAVFSGLLGWLIDKSGGLYWWVTFGLGGLLAVVAFIAASGGLGLFAFILIALGVFGLLSDHGEWSEF
jgi:hypothetical protein